MLTDKDIDKGEVVLDRKKLKKLRSVAVTIAGTSAIDINVEKKEKGGVANTVFETQRININEFSIPKKIRDYPDLSQKVREGLAVHEGAHWKYTLPYKKTIEHWIDKDSELNSGAKRRIMNIVADKIVNTNVYSTYRYDLAKKLEFEMDIIKKSFHKDMKEILKEAREKMQNREKSEDIYKAGQIINLIGMKGLYNIDVEDFLPTDPKIKKKVTKAIDKSNSILEDTAYSTSQEAFEKSCDKIAEEVRKIKELIEEERERDSEIDEDLDRVDDLYDEDATPIHLGGKHKIEGDENIIDYLKEDKDLDSTSDGNNFSGEGSMAGKGSGQEIPNPPPNKDNYRKLVNKNSEEISRLLNLLKKTKEVTPKSKQWKKHGRFMSEVSGKAYARSFRRSVADIHEITKFKTEESKTVIGLLIDISGSMNLEDAKDSLTIIGEVGYRWLKDEQLAILVFGANYQKVKAFIESGATTKKRIGGVNAKKKVSNSEKENRINRGGTVMYKPVKALQRMFNSMRDVENKLKKVLVIVSDFRVSNVDKAQKAINKCKANGIDVLGIGLGNTSKNRVSAFTGENSTSIEDITNLPEKFFEIYKEITGGYV